MIDFYLKFQVFIVKSTIFQRDNICTFNFEGWSQLMQVLKVFPGSVSTCVKALNEGNLMAIAPGGVREGNLSHHCALFSSYDC